MMDIILLIFLGLVCGMGVNYLSDVLPWKRKPADPLCIACYWDAYRQAEQAGNPESFVPPQGKYPWLNYFLFPRRCPQCGRRRGLRVLIVELVYILITTWLWSNYPEELGFWASLFWLVYFGIVVVIDLEYRLILHPVSLFGAAAGLVTGFYLHGWGDALLGGAVGYGIMFGLYWLASVFIKLAGKMRGNPVNDVALGYGDVNLSGVLGLFLGYPGILGGLVLAVFIGGGVSLLYLLVMLVLRRYRLFTALPYGPFLVAGAVVLYYLRGIIFGV